MICFAYDYVKSTLDVQECLYKHTYYINFECYLSTATSFPEKKHMPLPQEGNVAEAASVADGTSVPGTTPGDLHERKSVSGHGDLS